MLFYRENLQFSYWIWKG